MTILDPSMFSSTTQAIELFKHFIRSGIATDAYADTTVFKAVVLTPPIKIDEALTSVFKPSFTLKKLFSLFSKTLTPDKFFFRGRIDTLNSPHYFIPDPCSPAFAENLDVAAKLTTLHTVFVSTADNSDMAIKAGDIVNVRLAQNADGTYNLQYGQLVGLVTASPVSDRPTACKFSSANSFKFISRTAAPTTLSDWPGVTPIPVACAAGALCSGFVQSKFYTSKNRTADDIKMIVIHATAGNHGSGRAKKSAMSMAKGSLRAKTASNKWKEAGKPTVMYSGKEREKCYSGPCLSVGTEYQLYEAGASAHYFVDQGGYVWQGVLDKDKAWHAGAEGSSVNSYSIGIEHNGLKNTGDTAWLTEEMYKASAKLSAGLVNKYNIPIQRASDHNGSGFLAHSEVPNQSHVDPGPDWDWGHYLDLVKIYAGTGDTAARSLGSAPGGDEADAPVDHGGSGDS